MKVNDFFQAVPLLAQEWDLGKTVSGAKGTICAWIYLMETLEESEVIVTIKDHKKLIGFCGYAKWDSKKPWFHKKGCALIRKLLFYSLGIKKRKALLEYYQNYNYVPKEFQNYFDGEVSILIVRKEFRGKGFGKNLLVQIFELAKKDQMKNLQILTDESCNYSFYEACGCEKLYETVIYNYEPLLGSMDNEIGYLYEKKLM